VTEAFEPRPTRRVVQWATGNIGTRSLRAVIEHPHLDLVGVYVSSADKEGRDAGELCGAGPTGVIATRYVDEIVALAPDCVLYMPQGCDVDVLCRLLESGVNVVTTRGEFHHPPSMDPLVRERIESACARGGSSIHSTGSSPGFVSEALPIVLMSLQRRLDHLHIMEFADLATRNSPELLFDIMGYGREPEVFDRSRWAHGAAAFGPTLRLFADAIGRPLDEVVASGDVATATHDVTIAAGTIPAGTVAAQRMTVDGLRDGEPLVRFSATWYCARELDADWDLGDTGWRLVVDGDAPFEATIRFTVPVERMAETTPGYTAHRAVNAVHVVCDAAPGIRTTADLPQVIADLSA
jgi:4-hydroxy-tetrahydrodipicolinate reductase